MSQAMTSYEQVEHVQQGRPTATQTEPGGITAERGPTITHITSMSKLIEFVHKHYTRRGALPIPPDDAEDEGHSGNSKSGDKSHNPTRPAENDNEDLGAMTGGSDRVWDDNDWLAWTAQCLRDGIPPNRITKMRIALEDEQDEIRRVLAATEAMQQWGVLTPEDSNSAGCPKMGSKSFASIPVTGIRLLDKGDVAKEHRKFTAMTVKFGRPPLESAEPLRYVPEPNDNMTDKQLSLHNVIPMCDVDGKPARLAPPFPLAPINRILRTSSGKSCDENYTAKKWMALLDVYPEFKDRLERLGVAIPCHDAVVSETETESTDNDGVIALAGTSTTKMWLRDRYLKNKLASHDIFLPKRLRLRGSKAVEVVGAVREIYHRLVLRARDYLSEMEVRDATLLNDKGNSCMSDVSMEEVPSIHLCYDVFKGVEVPLPQVLLKRVLNFLRDNDVDRMPGWKHAVTELREYLDFLLPRNNGTSWKWMMQEVYNLLTAHKVFEGYYYSCWDFPLGVEIVERPRRKRPLGFKSGAAETAAIVPQLLSAEVAAGAAKRPPPPLHLLSRKPVAVGTVAYGPIENLRRDLYPYLEVMAAHEAAMWLLPARRLLSRDKMKAWLLEHRRKCPTLNPCGINAAMIENDEYERCVRAGPQLTIRSRKAMAGDKNAADVVDKVTGAINNLQKALLDPLTSIALRRGNARAGMQQCLRQMNQWGVKAMASPARRVHFPKLQQVVPRGHDAGRVFRPITLSAARLTPDQTRSPFVWTETMITHRRHVASLASSMRHEMNSRSDLLHDLTMYQHIDNARHDSIKTLMEEAGREYQRGQLFIAQRKRENLQHASKRSNESDRNESTASDTATVDLINVQLLPVRLPTNFHGPFLYRAQMSLHESWLRQLQQLEQVYPKLLAAYQRAPRALLHSVLEHICYGRLTPYGARHTMNHHLRNRGSGAGEEHVKKVFEKFVQRMKTAKRFNLDFGEVDPHRREDWPLLVESGNFAPKMVLPRDVSNLMLLETPPRTPEAMRPLEPRHPLFLNFWSRLKALMMSPRANNPWHDVNSRVCVMDVMALVNGDAGEESAGKGPTPSCERFRFARSDVINYIERLHAQHRIFYERDERVVGGWVLPAAAPEWRKSQVFPESRFVWDGNAAEVGTSEHPVRIESWAATVDAFSRWHGLREAVTAKEKHRVTAEETGTFNFMVAPETVDYLHSVAYRLGYTIRMLKGLLRGVPGVPRSTWNFDHEDDLAEVGQPRQDLIVSINVMRARLAAWEAAVLADPEAPSLKDVVRFADPTAFRLDMSEAEARELIGAKLIEEANQKNSMLWPSQRKVVVDQKTGFKKLVINRDNIWDWAHPRVAGNSGRRFFHLDRWPLAVLPAEELNRRIHYAEGEDINGGLDPRLLENPLAGDIPVNRECYQPVVWKKVGEDDGKKFHQGPPVFAGGDTPMQQQVVEHALARTLDDKSLESFVRSTTKDDKRALEEPSPSKNAEEQPEPETPQSKEKQQPKDTSNRSSGALSGHRKQQSAILRLLGNTFRKPWLQYPLPTASGDTVPKSVDATSATATSLFSSSQQPRPSSSAAAHRQNQHLHQQHHHGRHAATSKRRATADGDEMARMMSSAHCNTTSHSVNNNNAASTISRAESRANALPSRSESRSGGWFLFGRRSTTSSQVSQAPTQTSVAAFDTAGASSIASLVTTPHVTTGGVDGERNELFEITREREDVLAGSKKWEDMLLDANKTRGIWEGYGIERDPLASSGNGRVKLGEVDDGFEDINLEGDDDVANL